MINLEYQKDREQHKNIKHIGLEELGNSKLCEILLRTKLNFILESDKSGDDYEPNSDSETDKERHKKLPLPDQEVECEMCDSTYQFQSGFRAHVKLSHSGQFKWTQCTYLFEDTAKT